jgi:branched-chain amino acid transport system permease protein
VTLGSATFVLQNVIEALSLGGLYALIALGIALIFGIVRLVNFAHGEIIMVGAYMIYVLQGFGWPIFVLGAVAGSVIVAVAMDQVAFRPVRGADPSTLLITSFAVSVFIQSAVNLTATPEPRALGKLPEFLGNAVYIGSLRISVRTLLTTGTAVILLIALAIFLKRTRMGIYMRAAAEDFGMARLLGVRANVVIACAFALSGLLAGVVAVLLVFQTGTIVPTMGLLPVLIGFVATVLGGLGSPVGAALGGLLLGCLTIALQAALPEHLRLYRDAFVFALVIVVLLLRPQGLLAGRAARERV